MDLREAKCSYFFTPEEAGSCFIPMIINAIDEYKWVQSEKHGYDIGWEKATIDFFKKEYKKWFYDLIYGEAFEKLMQRGNEFDKEVADFFIKIGERLMEFQEDRFLRVVSDMRIEMFYSEKSIVDIVEKESPKLLAQKPLKRKYSAHYTI